MILTFIDFKQTGPSSGHGHNFTHQNHSQNGSNHEMRSINGMSAQDSKTKPPSVISSITKAPNMHQIPAHEPQASTSLSVRNDSVATRTPHADTIPASNKATLSGDSTAWLRFKDDHISQAPVSSRTTSDGPSRDGSKTNLISPPGLQTDTEDAKTDPYTGDARVSRATGSVFIPAHGATTTPTITIHVA
jgi:hypothetical protein